MREHFGIGFRAKHDAAALAACAQLSRVFDDAVVNDREALACVTVRMRIAIARLAVRRPARVRDAGRPFQLLRQRRSRSRTLPLLL